MTDNRDESARLHINTTWPPKGRARRTALGLAAMTAAAGTIMVLSAAGGAGVAGANPSAITLCHATASVTNPYVVIKVAPNSIKEKIFGQNGHATHLGPIFDPNGGKNQPVWGDIIPPFSYGNPVRQYPGLNWDATGIAIWENGCQLPVAGPSTSESASMSESASTSESASMSESASTSESASLSTSASLSASTSQTSGSSSVSPTSAHRTHHTHSAGPVHSASHSQAGVAQQGGNAPIPAGVSAGLHTPIADAGLKAWGVVLMVLGGAVGLLAGLWPTRRRAH